MAGKPGMKGGGGKRSGAGRKPAESVNIDVPAPVSDLLAHKDPKVFLLALMNELTADIKVRADAAKALMPFMHAKIGEAGKKDEKQNAAKKAGFGKFASAAPPLKLVSR